jgi:hypothetical protein
MLGNALVICSEDTVDQVRERVEEEENINANIQSQTSNYGTINP